ncbi:MAG TPA: molybdopterin cofactor-binding domain-containing protein, partial [Streptosporangiaceae bacterium]
MSILGTRVLRVEDPRFLTTGGVYTEDVVDERLAGSCHLTFVRSPIAHAKIAAIDVSAALESAGVVAVYTGADLASLPARKGFPEINQEMAQHPLAIDTVRFVGEPVAAVLTQEPYQGEDAAELVSVDYDPLPAVVGYSAALADETLLFPAAGTNVAATFGDRDEASADLFADCEVVVTATIENQRVAPAPMESRSAAAVWEDGRLTAWIPNQGAQGTRGGLARQLHVAKEKVRVITPDVGGAFGAKFGADPEHAVVCWAARELGRPVRWSETRFENLVAMTHGRAQRQTITIGGSRDGDVRAYRIDIVQDCGAYPRIGAILPSLTILMAPGPYDIPQAEAFAAAVVTNTTPLGAYRGAGRPEATAALERAMDLFAAEIGADPEHA